jgi:ubiquitin carboxyl-terminal hydrolase 25
MSETDRHAWDILGTTMKTHSSGKYLRSSLIYLRKLTHFSLETVEYAYKHQVKCNPSDTVSYFTFLNSIRQWAHEIGHPSYDSLQITFSSEQSKGLWTSDDLRIHAETLGLLDQNGHIPGDLTGDQIREAWRSKVKLVNDQLKALNIPVTTGTYVHSPKKEDLEREARALKEAYRVVAESTGDEAVIRTYKDTMKLYSGMDVVEAYNTMDAPETVDDDMLVTLYNIRVSTC